MEERVVLVTGGARGLGAAICRSLATDGWKVLSADVRKEMAEDLAASLRSQGCRAEAVELDVRDAEQVRSVLESVRGRCGRLDALVNNAGIDVTVSIEELSVEEWDQIVATNLRGPFVMSKYALPIMREQRSGHIINVASTAAKRAWPNAAAYHASKWGLLGFSHALHTEARPLGVKVTALVVGGMRTPFLFDRFPDIDPQVLQDPADVAEAVKFILGQPSQTVIPEVMVIPMRETSWP